MKKLYILLLFFAFSATAQEREVKTSKFVNQTEIALLAGRSYTGGPVYTPYSYPYPWYPSVPTYKEGNTASFSVQTFNGWRVKPGTAVGLTTGFDAYQAPSSCHWPAEFARYSLKKAPPFPRSRPPSTWGWGTYGLTGKTRFRKRAESWSIPP
ncbi:MAG: hypothetical protein LRY55_08895 [Leadbetterella sp.]|nr:hypothetical protein [Leadbetterella sp.]